MVSVHETKTKVSDEGRRGSKEGREGRGGAFYFHPTPNERPLYRLVLLAECSEKP